MSVFIHDFGKTTDGRTVKEAILKNEKIEVHLLSYGAAIRRMIVADSKGNPVDVALGYDEVSHYELNGGCMGVTIGRYANRIKNAQFPLYEEVVRITPNENGNCLHSGLSGFMKQVFAVSETPDTENSVTMTAVSPAGTDGFPGTVELEVQFELAGCGLVIRYYATTDAPTVCNMTNHSYFNLNGQASGTVLGHRLSMDADYYLETDEGSCPTGRKIPVAETPMDFTEEKTLGRDIGADYPALKIGNGYDHCFVLRDTGLRHAAWLTGPETGIRMEVLTTLPAMQVYTANYLEPQTPGLDGAAYHKNCSVALETEDYPDAPNHPDFPDTTLLPGEPYSSTTVYRFDVEKR